MTTMSTSRKRLAVLLTALALAPWLAPRAARGGTSPLEGWTRLRYTTNKLVVFSGELSMERTQSGDKTTVRTESRAKLFGSQLVDTWSVSTMDRKSGKPQSFLDVRPRKKAERYTFGETGILRETLKPRKDAPEEPFEKWRVSKKETLPLEAKSATSPASVTTTTPPAGGASQTSEPSRWVHDYIAMIVRLHDLPLRKTGDEATVRVLTSKGAVPMRVRVSEERNVSRDLKDLVSGKTTSVSFHELRLRVTPLAGSPSETRGFMNMEGETELWVDADTRTLLEISGEVPKVPGRVVITMAGYKK